MSDDESRQIGINTQRCTDLENDVHELKSRPSLPKWICKFASTITIGGIAVVIFFGGMAYYRLNSVESSCAAVDAKYDKLAWAVAVEMSRAPLTNSETFTLVQPPKTDTITKQIIKVNQSDPQHSIAGTRSLSPIDSAQAYKIYSRLMAND